MMLNALGSVYSIHFHVWTRSAFLELLRHCQDRLGMPFKIERVEAAGAEFIVILRKAAPSVEQDAAYAAPKALRATARQEGDR